MRHIYNNIYIYIRTFFVALTLTFYLTFFVAPIRTFFLAFYLASIQALILAIIPALILESILIFYLAFCLAFYLASILTFSRTCALPDLSRERQSSSEELRVETRQLRWGPAVPTVIWSSLLGEGGKEGGKKGRREEGKEESNTDKI